MAEKAAWWQRYGTLAQMAQVVVALCGFMAILFQINTIRESNRAAGARQVYLGYTDLSFRNPQFSSPDYAKIKASSVEEQVKYENFVSYFLYACEETMKVATDQHEWRASCDYDLKLHLPFLCEKNAAEPHYLETYSADTRRWLLSAMQQSGVTAPACTLRKT
jgi:hypothetical protein